MSNVRRIAKVNGELQVIEIKDGKYIFRFQMGTGWFLHPSYDLDLSEETTLEIIKHLEKQGLFKPY